MPKISDDQRAARRAQILKAARACFLREGLHATTMQDILRESGLSAGAVYSYFQNKEELIQAAIADSLTGLRALLDPLFQRALLPPPDVFLREIVAAVEGFSARREFDLKRLALLGWSESQRNEHLRQNMRVYYRGFRDQLSAAVDSWKLAGELPSSCRSDEVAKVLLACIMGFVAQGAILGEVTPDIMQSGLRQLGREGGLPA